MMPIVSFIEAILGICLAHMVLSNYIWKPSLTGSKWTSKLAWMLNVCKMVGMVRGSSNGATQLNLCEAYIYIYSIYIYEHIM